MAEVLSIVGRKGGCSKSTTAWNLAGVFSEREPVLLIDADPSGSLAALVRESERLRVLHAPTPAALSSALERAERGLVIVDCPPLLPEPVAAAVARSRLVLVPLMPSPLDLRAAAPIFAALREKNAPAHLAVLVKVRAGTRVVDATRAALADLGARTARATLGYRVVYQEAAGARKSVVEFAPRSRAAAEIRALAGEVRRALRR